MSASRRIDNPGFTLVELLLSVTILMIVMAAIVSGMIVFLRTGSEASYRNDHSAAASLMATYLDRDLASTVAVEPSRTCGVPSTASHLLTLRATDFSASATSPSPSPKPTSQFVTYYQINDAAIVGDRRPRSKIVRRTCNGATSGALAPAGTLETTVAERLLTTPSPLTMTYTASDSACTSSKPSLKVTLTKYGDDASTAANPYVFQTCLTGRLS